MSRLKIAGLHIACELTDGAFWHERLARYREPEPAEPAMRLTAGVYDELEEPPGEQIERIRAATLIRTGDGRIARCLRDRATGRVAAVIKSAPDYADVDIRLWQGRRHPVCSLTDFEYIYSGLAFGDRLLQMGGTVVHGSALAMDGRGIIFSANSGVGKSTHAMLWKARFGDEVAIVNDDKPAVRFIAGKPYIFGTPWSGKTDLNANVRAPLSAIVFIERSTVNRLERLGARDAIFALSGQMERPYYDRRLGELSLERLERLIETVPVYRLHCTISQQAVDTVYAEIMAKRGIER